MADQDSDSKLSTITADITVAVLILFIALALFGAYIDRIFEWYRGIIEWFYSQEWNTIKRVLTILFTVINIGLVTLIIYSIRRIYELRYGAPEEEKEIHVLMPKDEVRESWENIRELANSSNPSDWNMAVLRADALLDDILQHLGYEGITMAERLKIVDPVKMPSLDRLWSAHRMRNMIAHDPLEQHTRESIIHALKSYEQVLKELGMMEYPKPYQE